MEREKTSCAGERFEVRCGTKNSKFAPKELLAVFKEFESYGFSLLVDRTEKGRMWVDPGRSCEVGYRIDGLSLERVRELLGDLAVVQRNRYIDLINAILYREGTADILQAYVDSDGGSKAWEVLTESYKRDFSKGGYDGLFYRSWIDYRGIIREKLPEKRKRDESRMTYRAEVAAIQEERRCFVEKAKVITDGRTDLDHLFKAGPVLYHGKLVNTPYLAFTHDEKTGKVTVVICRYITELFMYPPDTRVMVQWPGQWSTDYFHMSIRDVAQACCDHSRGTFLEAKQYLLRQLPKAAG